MTSAKWKQHKVRYIGLCIGLDEALSNVYTCNEIYLFILFGGGGCIFIRIEFQQQDIMMI